jgi:hypothetical protein
MGTKLAAGPMSTNQVAGGHPDSLAQDKGVEGGEAPHRPRVNKPGRWRPSSPTGQGKVGR